MSAIPFLNVSLFYIFYLLFVLMEEQSVTTEVEMGKR